MCLVVQRSWTHFLRREGDEVIVCWPSPWKRKALQNPGGATVCAERCVGGEGKA